MPAQPTPPPQMGSPMGSPSPSMPSASADPASGSTMISVPAEAFDMLHSLIAELLKALDSLKSEGAGGMSPEMGEDMPEGGGMPMGGDMGGDDEDFLSAMAAEGSNRSR